MENLDIIYAYTRADAIEDGNLVDVSETAKEAGFGAPVAMTRTVYERIVTLPTGYKGWQDESGRLWDVLYMCALACRRNPNKSRVVATVLVRDIRKDMRDSNRPPKQHHPIVVIGPGDEGEAVITIMFPEDD